MEELQSLNSITCSDVSHDDSYCNSVSCFQHMPCPLAVVIAHDNVIAAFSTKMSGNHTAFWFTLGSLKGQVMSAGTALLHFASIFILTLNICLWGFSALLSLSLTIFVVHMTAGLLIVQKNLSLFLFYVFNSNEPYRGKQKCPRSAPQYPPLCMPDAKVGHQVSCATDQRSGEEASKGDSVRWQSVLRRLQRITSQQ